MTTIVPLPSSPKPLDVTFNLMRFGNDIKPPLGGPEQRIVRLGTRFSIELQYPPMTYDVGRQWLALLMAGETNPVSVGFPQRGLRPVSPGAVTARSGSSGGVLEISGGTDGFTLKQGQFFSLASAGRRWIHQLQNDVTLTGGQVALPINPLLRVQPATGDTLEFVAPLLEGFVQGDKYSWTIEMVRRVGLKFTVAEDR